MTSIPKSVPQLSLASISEVESKFLVEFAYEHYHLDTQVMLNRLISYSFADKVAWLADREAGFELAVVSVSTDECEAGTDECEPGFTRKPLDLD